MSLIAKSLSPRQIFHLARVFNAAQSKQCHWFPDYKPGPYPRTKEEREAAAKKYNLLPEEYEPYPEEETSSGDYPKLPFESVDSRDPFETWTQPQLRRNFMEPINRNIMILLPEALSTEKSQYSTLYAYSVFFGFIGIMAFFYFYGKKWIVELPVMEKQYSRTGEKHYTFELVKRGSHHHHHHEDHNKESHGSKHEDYVEDEEDYEDEDGEQQHEDKGHEDEGHGQKHSYRKRKSCSCR